MGGLETDVFPAIATDTGEVWRLQNYQTSHIEDIVASDFPFTHILRSVESDAETRYTTQLWDYDIITANELMTSISFTPENLDISST